MTWERFKAVEGTETVVIGGEVFKIRKSLKAKEVREILAEMGVKKLDDMIGRRDLLEIRTFEEFPGSKRVKLKEFLIENYPQDKPLRCLIPRNDNPRRSELAKKLEEEIVPYIEKGEKVFKKVDLISLPKLKL